MDEYCNRWIKLGHIPDAEMREFLFNKIDQEYILEEIFYRCSNLINPDHFSMIGEFAENSKTDCI